MGRDDSVTARSRWSARGSRRPPSAHPRPAA